MSTGDFWCTEHKTWNCSCNRWPPIPNLDIAKIIGTPLSTLEPFGLKEEKQMSELNFKNYIKKPIPIQACQMKESFTVDTLEGLITGKPGDYLIIGVRGEMYPCDREIFEETYERFEDLNER